MRDKEVVKLTAGECVDSALTQCALWRSLMRKLQLRNE